MLKGWVYGMSGMCLKGMTPIHAAGGRRSGTKCNKWFLDVIENLYDETKSVLEIRYDERVNIQRREPHCWGTQQNCTLYQQLKVMTSISQDEVQ